MLTKGKLERGVTEIVALEDLVPKEHLLRKIDAAVDWERIYEMVEPLYSEDNGRPSVDEEAAKAGYLSPEVVYIDGTHIKANANIKKRIETEAPAAACRYASELFAEVNEDREEHGLAPLAEEPRKKKKDNTSKKKQARRKKEKKKAVSVTDPESGMFIKGEHQRCFAYEAHTACDENGFVLETVVTPGNVHDSVAFDELYDKVIGKYPEIETVAADSAYKTPHICKKVFEDDRVLTSAYKRPQTMKGGHAWWKYVYDEYYDCIICPEYQILNYATTNREGRREYRSDPKVCANCPTRHLCTHAKDCVKTVERHIWQDWLELAEDARYTPEYRTVYKRRKETIERAFADAKEKHGMRWTPYRGLAQVTNWVRLKFVAMNLKKLAKWKWRDRPRSLVLLLSSLYLPRTQPLTMRESGFFDRLGAPPRGCSRGMFKPNPTCPKNMLILISRNCEIQYFCS